MVAIRSDSAHPGYKKGEMAAMESHMNLGKQLMAASGLPVEKTDEQVVVSNQAEIVGAPGTGGILGAMDEMGSEELLKKVAGESEVEIVNLLKTEIGDRYDNHLTYRLRVRADMERLISFLQVLEHWGLDRVVIDRVSAKRRGNVWETNLEVTSYFGPVCEVTSEVASK